MSRAASVAGIATMLCASIRPAMAESTIDLDERVGLLVVRMSPRAATDPLPSDRLFGLLDRVIKDRTRLSVRSPEQAGIDITAMAGCPLERRMTCWVEEVDRAKKSAAIVSATRRVPPLMLVISMLQLKSGEVEVSAMLLDLDRAIERVRARPGDLGPEAATALENELYDEAVRPDGGRMRLEDDSALIEYFDRAFFTDFRPALEARGFEVPAGAISLDIAGDGLIVEIDDVQAGVARSGRTEIRGVAPGERKVTVRDPTDGAAIFSQRVNVRPSRVEAVTVVARPDAAPPEDLVRTVGFWSGLGLVAAGAVVSVVAIFAAPDSKIVTPCLSGRCDGANELDFVDTCTAGSDRPSDCSGSGLLLAPLGYSLVATGAVWAGGSAIASDDAFASWIPIVAGVLIGGAAYGISAAAN